MEKGQLLKGEFHIHSKYSYDSLLEPEHILKKASHLGINILSITDHETMRGSLAALEMANKYGIEVWLGMEIATNVGDIIGIRLKEEVRSRDWIEVIKDIRGQGGLVILPHPFRGHKLVEKLAMSVDLIEIFNGRDSPANIKKAGELAKKFGKPGIVGSDAHVFSEIGNAINSFHDILSFEKEYQTKRSNRFERTYSYLIKDAKKRTYRKIPRDLLRLIE